MMLLKEVFEKDIGIKDDDYLNCEYKIRKAARAIVVKGDYLALMNVTQKKYHKLPGGGLEIDESIYEALNREISEEVGITVNNIVELGCIIEYRKQHKLLQISYCFIADYWGDLRNNNLCEIEKEEGFLVNWVHKNQIKSLLQSDTPKDYVAKMISCRDKVFIDYYLGRTI